MAVAATLLFGSLARADHSEGSDTDLLMISLDEDMRQISVGHLSLFLYPWHRLQQDARDGDLFVCHLVREAKPLIDPDNYLPKLQGRLPVSINLS
jgi:predicted nucleotidyltransferase